MQIGRFMRLTQLSRKALRLYEQLDILCPTAIDPQSGYRYYAEEQIGVARLIRLLRGMEMPLALVRQVVEAEPPAAVQLVVRYEQDMARRAELVSQAAQRVYQILNQENNQMTFEIQVRDVAPQQIVAHLSRVKIADYQAHIRQTLQLLHSHIIESGATLAGDPICFYHGPLNEGSDGPVEICWPYQGNVAPTTSISVRQLPAHKLAYHHATMANSRFPNILGVWEAVIDWARQNGYETMPEGLDCYEVWPQDETVVIGWPMHP